MRGEKEETMTQKTKGKRKRTGFIVLLAILACIVLLLAAGYVYLATDQFSIGVLRENYDPDAKYDGKAAYLPDGDVELSLDANDLYWLADTYRVQDSFEMPSVVLKNYAVEIGENVVTLYANAELFGAIPVPLKVVCAAKVDSALDLAITSVNLGKWFEIPVEKLAQFGLESHYRIALDGMLSNDEIQSLRIEKDQIVVTIPFLQDFDEQVIPDMTADTLLLYGAEASDAVQCASACYRSANNGERSDAILAYITGAKDPVEAMTKLLALCDESTTAKILEAQDPFEAHFLMPVTAAEITDGRAENIGIIAEYNRGLETMLHALREKYKALSIELTRNGYLDAATQEPFSLASLSPQLGLNEEQCHPVLLIATETKRAATTADMPQFSEIPKSKGLKLDMALDYMSYDIGAMLKLPGGSTAMLYFASTGEMVIQCLPEETAESTFLEYRVPKLLNLDLAVFSPLRVQHDAPAPDLSRYIIFLPWDIGMVWTPTKG